MLTLRDWLARRLWRSLEFLCSSRILTDRLCSNVESVSYEVSSHSSCFDLATRMLTGYQFADGAIVTGPLKAVKFRVEFSSNLSSPSMGSSPRDLYPTGVTLIMEKGAHSTFKATYNRLRSAWEYAASSLRSHDVRTDTIRHCRLDSPRYPNGLGVVRLIPSPMPSPILGAHNGRSHFL